MTWELKRLEHRNLERAVTLAKHYRDLNQPEDAASICQDVLDVAPENQDAIRTLGLALTDMIASQHVTRFDEAIAVFKRLKVEYEQVYYAGIAWERYAKEQLASGSDTNAVHAFEEAIALFEKAEQLGAKDDPAPILHYNHCVRTMTTHAGLVRVSQTDIPRSFDYGD